MFGRTLRIVNSGCIREEIAINININIRDTFVIPSGRAGEYGADLMEQNGAPLALTAVDALAPASGERILEVGFGPGLALELMTARIPHGHLTGIDLSRVMHRRASARNAAAITAGLLDLVHGSVADMPFADGEFDGVLSIDNAHFWPHLASNLEEVARVLRPGGRLIIAFTPVSGGPPHALERAITRAGFVAASSRRTSDGVLFSAQTPRP